MSLVYNLNIKAIKEVDEALFQAIEEAPNADHVEIMQSKTNHPVPRINGIMVHSIFDPIKEADAFLQSYESVIKAQEILLVMGYGFGYHVDALAERARKDHKYIFVIEPDISVFKKAIQLRDVSSLLDVVTFIIGFDISSLFAIPGFYKILNAAPYTIGYKPAIQINEDYFSEFVKRRSSNKVEHLMLEADENEELIGIIKKFDSDAEVKLNEIIDTILSQREPLNRTEKMFLLMGELSN